MDQFWWPHQAQYIVHLSSSSLIVESSVCRIRVRCRGKDQVGVKAKVRVRVRSGFPLTE